MKFTVSLVAGVVLLGLFSCLEFSKNTALGGDGVGEKRPKFSYALKITVQDDNSVVKMEKTVQVPTRSYMPTLEKKDDFYLLRWYEGYNGGGVFLLKPGWSASWEQIYADDEVKK